MREPYEIYGIPDNFQHNDTDLPDYAIIDRDFNAGDVFYDSSGLNCGDVRLWGQADSWTALEAALLLAGVAPDHYDLYGVITEGVTSGEIPPHGSRTYYWKYTDIFYAARDYLFLFERSKLAPKSPPIEWVKYFNNKVRNAPIKHPFEPRYCDDWLEFLVLNLVKSNRLRISKNQSQLEKLRTCYALLQLSLLMLMPIILKMQSLMLPKI